MTDIFTETTAEFRRLGGWAVVFRPGESGLGIDARHEADHVQVSCNTGVGRTP